MGKLVWEGMLDDIAPWWCHCSGRVEWLDDMLEQKELPAPKEVKHGENVSRETI